MAAPNPEPPAYATAETMRAVDAMPLDHRVHMADLWRHGYRETGRALAEHGRESVTAIVRGLHDVLDRTTAEFVARVPRKVACGDRCHYCCFQHVMLSPAEVFTLAEHIQVKGIAVRDLDAYAATLAGVSHHDRQARLLACPLLKARRCSVYEDRPEECRSHLSLSRVACERDHRQRHKPSEERSGVGRGIPMLAEPKVFNPALLCGSDWALHEAGYQIVWMELTPLLAQCSRPGVYARWCAGERVLEAAGNDDYVFRLQAMAVAVLAGDRR